MSKRERENQVRRRRMMTVVRDDLARARNSLMELVKETGSDRELQEEMVGLFIELVRVDKMANKIHQQMATEEVERS